MIGFIVLGPLLFAAQSIAQGVGAREAASDFVKLAARRRRGAYAAFERAARTSTPNRIDKVTIYTGRRARAGGPADERSLLHGDRLTREGRRREGGHRPAPATWTTRTRASTSETEADADAQLGDARANDTTANASTLKIAQALLFPALLGLVVMMIYVPLQAQRVGLLTRFFGSFGMALGASLILILPVALLGVLIWTGYLGLLFVGRVPKGRPPAWEAGEAIPWQRPGEEPADVAGSDEQVVEGDASEIASGDVSSQGSSDAPAAEKRKRKRRR